MGAGMGRVGSTVQELLGSVLTPTPDLGLRGPLTAE